MLSYENNPYWNAEFQLEKRFRLRNGIYEKTKNF